MPIQSQITTAIPVSAVNEALQLFLYLCPPDVSIFKAGDHCPDGRHDNRHSPAGRVVKLVIKPRREDRH